LLITTYEKIYLITKLKLQ